MFSCGRFCVSSVARIVPSSSLWQSFWTRLVARWDPNRFYHDRICVRYHLEANGCCLVFWPCTRCIRWRPSSLGDDIDAATQKKKKNLKLAQPAPPFCSQAGMPHPWSLSPWKWKWICPQSGQNRKQDRITHCVFSFWSVARQFNFSLPSYSRIWSSQKQLLFAARLVCHTLGARLPGNASASACKVSRTDKRTESQEDSRRISEG